MASKIANSAEPSKHQEADPERGEGEAVDYLARANWLRAAVLGANDGLVSVASLMVGVGAVNQTAKAMVVSGLAGLVAGACSMAIGEFVSVYAQYDIMKAQKERTASESSGAGEEEESLPSPLKAAGASAFSFFLGAVLPLLAGGFIRPWAARVGAVCGVTTLGLAGFGAAGGLLGGAAVGKSSIRVVIGGCLAMLITYGVLRLFGLVFQMQVSASA
ncbi:unnamed protein product [Spirodela intermedia]|uniref:Vacuolar iron transporter n=1 Tax=Spirodela intermedia TaxID=51605 RepID=A0A7I8K492_SPIIN|nr:unnamed protein product [Spirodela intermedia]CAA7392030.1 unnamed protein product [Spirodela intermedia]